MTHGYEPCPDTDTDSDTIEFAAIEQVKPERICYEVSSGVGVRLTHFLDTPVEIRLGQTTETSPFFLHEGDDFPDLCEAEGVNSTTRACVLVQPNVMEKNSMSGWLVISEWTEIGRAEHPQFRLGRDISRRGHIALGPVEGGAIEIVGTVPNPTKVLVESKYPLSYYELAQ
jgi:hypothetical protein